METLISVIVPVYNIESYISKCVESLCSQTYTNLEIILVDDGSSDSSSFICDAYAKQDERIMVIHKENDGLSEARNAGLKCAHGQYLMFIDGDDYVDHTMIEKMYETLVQDDSDMVLCNYEYVDEYGNLITKEMEEIFEDNKDKIVISEDEYWQNYYDYNCSYYVISCNKLYKRKIFQNIQFPKGKIHEDEYVFHQILRECNRISCMRNQFYKYVQRENSITAKKIGVKNLYYLDALMERMEYLILTKKYEHVDYAFSQGIARLLRFKTEIGEMNSEEEQVYYDFCKKWKRVAKKILMLKKQSKRTRIKAFIYMVGGMQLYCRFSKTMG